MLPPELSEAIPLVEEVVRSLARRHNVSREEADELMSRARLKLVENDSAVLAKFTGGSTLRTYLTTVVHRLLLDYRRQEWGKWRPSAAARRMGPLGVRLELLLHRDGRSLEEASRLIAGSEPAELEAIAAKLPARVGRRMEGEEALLAIGVSADGVEAGVLEREREPRRGAVESGLAQALQSVTPRERLMLRMRFQDGFTVGEIARALHLDEKPLYRGLERLLAKLRAELESRGVTAEDVADVLGSASWEPPPLLATKGAKSVVADV